MSDWRQDLFDAMITKVESLVDVPVIEAFTISEEQYDNLPEFVMVTRLEVTADTIPETKPTNATTEQEKYITWLLEVKSGGGASGRRTARRALDDLLGQLYDGLKAHWLLGEDPPGDAGPLNFVSESYIGRSGVGYAYQQVWTHTHLGSC